MPMTQDQVQTDLRGMAGSAVPPARLLPAVGRVAADLADTNGRLEALDARGRVSWALERFGERVVLSSSFGAQAAVCLHLVTRLCPGIPVVVVDTGYLFPETYRFIDELTDRLSLNLKVYRPVLSSAWQEARHGRLWEEGLEGITRFNEMNKVEPMARALRELAAEAWISGLRRSQSSTRKDLKVLAIQPPWLKVHPIIDWTDRDVHRYLTEHGLPYHPLRDEGYISIGDVHTSHKLTDGMTEEQARFFGLKRECGLHDGAQSDYQI